jgi:hypothetical protein
MREARSNSPTKCGICGGEAYTPQRFTIADRRELDGVFNVCSKCGAECSGTGARDDADRWYWSGARDVARGRAALEAMEIDAEFAEGERYGW